MDNGIKDLDVIIGKSRKGTERYFGRPDFIADTFTAYWREDNLLLLISGGNENDPEAGEVVKGYLLALSDGDLIVSDSVHLLDEKEAEQAKNFKSWDDIVNSGLPVHGDTGSGISIPIFLTDQGTAVIIRIMGNTVFKCDEVSLRDLFGRRTPSDDEVLTE